MVDLSLLDNPIWHALGGDQIDLSMGRGRARRFLPSISPLSALAEPKTACLTELGDLVEPNGTVGLFARVLPPVGEGWVVRKDRHIDQMICPDRLPAPSPDPEIRPLGMADVPEMVALTAATEPGPFAGQTIRMGRYFGIRAAEGRLTAMAGERLWVGRLREISAVCTDPAHRGRGLAARLIRFLVNLQQSEGLTPFLHVKTENPAVALYEKLGFRPNGRVAFKVITRA